MSEYKDELLNILHKNSYELFEVIKEEEKEVDLIVINKNSKSFQKTVSLPINNYSLLYFTVIKIRCHILKKVNAAIIYI